MIWLCISIFSIRELIKRKLGFATLKWFCVRYFWRFHICITLYHIQNIRHVTWMYWYLLDFQYHGTYNTYEANIKKPLMANTQLNVTLISGTNYCHCLLPEMNLKYTTYHLLLVYAGITNLSLDWSQYSRSEICFPEQYCYSPLFIALSHQFPGASGKSKLRGGPDVYHRQITERWKRVPEATTIRRCIGTYWNWS